MMAQIIKKGYTVNYDDDTAVILSGGKDVANFATVDGGATALVQALRWIKARGPAPLETDKGVFDPGQRDEFGNLVEIDPPIDDQDRGGTDLDDAESENLT